MDSSIKFSKGAKMQLKIHQAYRSIVTLADTDLIGKTFTEGIRQITLNPNFFKDKEVSKQQAIKTLQDMEKEDATFNIVGKESVQTALGAGIIKEHGIIKIQGVPVALGLF